MIFRHDSETEPSAEAMPVAMQQWQAWISDIAKQGKFSGTNRLLPEGKTLKPNNVVTDGPYVEAKEMLGGYVIVKTDSFEDAIKIAKSCPNLLYGGNVEVRSVMSIDSNPTSKTFLHPVN